MCIELYLEAKYGSLLILISNGAACGFMITQTLKYKPQLSKLWRRFQKIISVRMKTTKEEKKYTFD